MLATAQPALSPEELHTNYDPLNQLAKKYLRLEQQVPDPSSLYLIQLAQWGLDHGKLKLPSDEWRATVQASLENLLTWDPEKALTYLRDNPDDKQSPLLTKRQLRKAMSAKQAARVVLNALDLRMTVDETLDYPPTKYPNR